jgi:DNA helicase IV
MDQTEKDRLLMEAESDITRTTAVIGGMVEKLDHSIEATTEAYRKIDSAESETAFEDRERLEAAGVNMSARREEMAQLAQSPFFARCDAVFDDAREQPYYIAKYAASELGIYSWIAPVAALRFEAPGPVTYQTPDGSWREGVMTRRDQYMVARSHLNFMTTELVGQERELIYQEHFSGRKTGFVLPEVVAQMEKAQDQVIRAEPKGPFVISGPAGSGKTTLALHRVAFLRQSPETTDAYPSESILVLVQDNNTDNYFSHLLPELGITDVKITTFAHWAIQQLGLGHYFYHGRPGPTEVQRDRYEFAKLQAMSGPVPDTTIKELKHPESLLMRYYRDYLDMGQQGLLAGELEEGALDRFDLTLLLTWRRKLEGALMTTVEDVTYLRGGLTKRNVRPVPLEYSLVLVDEFQNYLPEQLRLLKSTTAKTRSMLYIGDIAQQTQLGAFHDWEQIGERVSPERVIQLEKVYRNTRQILEYIRSLGYSVSIPKGVSEGPPVAEFPARDVVEALQYIVGLTRVSGALLGIIAQDPAEIETYRDYFSGDDSVRCMTMREAQGVEFDIVCLVGLNGVIAVEDEPDLALAQVQARVNRDLFYVALTRAMTELHIIGPVSLTTI